MGEDMQPASRKLSIADDTSIHTLILRTERMESLHKNKRIKSAKG